MSLRIRKNGSIVCAAMTQDEDGDKYINDNTHYNILSKMPTSFRCGMN